MDDDFTLSAAEQDAIIEFLKTLPVLPPRTTYLAFGQRDLVVDEQGRPRSWRLFPYECAAGH